MEGAERGWGALGGGDGMGYKDVGRGGVGVRRDGAGAEKGQEESRQG